MEKYLKEMEPLRQQAVDQLDAALTAKDVLLASLWDCYFQTGSSEENEKELEEARKLCVERFHDVLMEKDTLIKILHKDRTQLEAECKRQQTQISLLQTQVDLALEGYWREKLSG